MSPRMLPLAALLILGACSSRPEPDARLVSERKALDAWQTGRDHLQAGRASEARAAFSTALEHQPADPLLLAWRARAEAADGDPRAAILTLDTVLGQTPDFAEARYNRAAYHARAGDLDRAADDLRRALAAGARDPREVLLDPDFVPHLDAPALAFLPRAPLDVSLKGPGGSVFVGSAATVRLQVTGLRLSDLRVSAPTLSGPFRLSRVEERLESLAGGDERLTLTWTLRVLGAGQATLGPFEVRSGPRTATSEADTLLTLAPEGHTVPDPVTVSFWRPSARLGDHQPTGEEPLAVWRASDGLFVLSPPSARVRRTDVDDATAIHATYLQDRQERWQLHAWPEAPATATVEVRRGGKVLYAGAAPD